MAVCPSCGQENPDGFRFCGACGVELAAEAPTAREQRKTVTVLFCDVVGSTALGESTDPEALRALLAHYFERMKEIVERHGGAVEKFIGDAVMAVFGIPVVHEDDALRAVRAAREMREAFPFLSVEGRIGIATGEVVTGTEERLVTGDAVNTAARLEQAAQPGEILLGEETVRLARSGVEVEALEPLELKGKAEPARVYRLVSVHATVRSRAEAPMVGRETELRRLRDAFAQAVHDRSCQLFTVLGTAGVGKSRLVAEFLVGLEVRIVRGHCLPYGEGITYWPVVEVIKQLEMLPADEAAASAIRLLLGETETGTSPEEIAWAFRKLLEQAAQERSLVCVFDDLHWGEETFLDLVEHVADLSRDAPILLLCMARPELLDKRPDWGGGKMNATTGLLEPLDGVETDRLVDALGGVADELRGRILEAAEGNPLFVEEMVALVRESGGDEVTVPPSIQALLAARLDQLGPRERHALQCGSIEGRVFHRGAVQVLAPEEPHLTARLTTLVRKELLRPDKPRLSGEDAYRFRHLLIRDAAYDALPKATRVQLHERFAGWLDQHGSELVELEEIVGYHLEQACRYRVELGSVGEATDALARAAAKRLGAAGGRAFLRRDAPAAVKLISRAVSLLPPDDPLRVDLIPNLRVIQGASGDLSWAETVLSEAIAGGDNPLKTHALVQRAFLRLFTASDVMADELIDVGEHAVHFFEEVGDELGLARAWRLIGQAHYLARRAGPSAEASEHALAHLRRVGDRLAEETETVEWLAVALLAGPIPVAEAVRRCELLLREVSGKPLLEVILTIVLANLLAMAGQLAEAGELMEQGRRLREEGVERVWFFPLNFALLTLLDEDPAAAERELRWGYEEQRRIGEKSHLSTIAALLARAMWAQGRYDEADRLTRESEEAAGANDVHSNILWRTTRGRVLAQRRELGTAEAIVREAVAFAAASDFLFFHGDALCDLAEVLWLGGKFHEATAALEQALALYERKGNVVMVDRTRGRLAENPA